MYKHILNGAIHIERNFFEEELYRKISKEIIKLKYSPGYQPGSYYYGNRFQAYPCYEVNLTKYNSIFISLFEKILQKRIDKKSFKCLVRKSVIEEIKKSKVNTPWGIVHYDPEEIAAVLYFDKKLTIFV